MPTEGQPAHRRCRRRNPSPICTARIAHGAVDRRARARRRIGRGSAVRLRFVDHRVIVRRRARARDDARTLLDEHDDSDAARAIRTAAARGAPESTARPSMAAVAATLAAAHGPAAHAAAATRRRRGDGRGSSSRSGSPRRSHRSRSPSRPPARKGPVRRPWQRRPRRPNRRHQRRLLPLRPDLATTARHHHRRRRQPWT